MKKKLYTCFFHALGQCYVASLLEIIITLQGIRDRTSYTYQWIAKTKYFIIKQLEIPKKCFFTKINQVEVGSTFGPCVNLRMPRLNDKGLITVVDYDTLELLCDEVVGCDAQQPVVLE